MKTLLSSICVAALCASPAWAQDAGSSMPAAGSGRATNAPMAAASSDDGGIADIVVTAQRREEALQDVPIAITALGRAQLEIAEVRDTLDLKKVTPGLSFNTSAAGYGAPRIRGIGTAAVGPGIENPVAVYVDGVYLASSNATLFSLTDVEQIAVLKGPQGTLFGRNATGGLIQITTRQPSENSALEGRLTYGNLERVAGDVYLTGGLAPGLSASFAGAYDVQNEGFGVNRTTGNDVQTHRNYAGRVKLHWELDDTSVTLSADYSKNKSADPAFRGLGIGLNGRRFIGGDRDIESDVEPFAIITDYGASLTVRHDFGSVELMSLTAYRKTQLHFLLDIDFVPEFFTLMDLHQTDKQFSQEFQLLSRTDGPFQWTVGGIYFWADAAFDPVDVSFPPGFTLRTNSKQRLTSLAGFAQGTYAFSDATNLTLGIRYTTDKRDIEGTQILLPFNIPTAPPQDGSKRFSKVTWRASLDHRFSPELLGYVSYNRGFKSGAFVSVSFPTQTVRPEVLDAYEVGLKSDLFDRRVRLNVAGFYYDYANPQAVQNAQGLALLLSAEGSESYGVDADAIIRATRNLTFNLGASYIHARYTSFLRATGSVPLPTGGNQVINPFDASGNRIQLTPDWTFNVSANYTIPTSFGDVTLTGSYYHNDGYFAEPENRLHQPAFDLVDASIGWTHPSGTIDVKLWGKNLTDELYTNQLTSTEAGDGFQAAAGRTYGVTAGFKF